MTIPPRSPLHLPHADKGTNTTISVSPNSPLLFKRLPELCLTPTSTCSTPSPGLPSPQLYSPLTMLFEGIIADSACTHYIQRASSNFPNSPLPSPGIHAGLPSTCSVSSSEASTIVPTPHIPADPEADNWAVEDIEQALEELIQQNTPSKPSCQLPLPEASWLERPQRRCREKVRETMNNDTFSTLTMPGGGPLFEPLISESSSPFFNSPLPQASTLGLFHASPTPGRRGPAPERPPRPSHCSATLEDLAPFTNPVKDLATTASTLRSIRKAPAEYLKDHRRSSSVRTLDTFGVPDPIAGLKVDPALDGLKAAVKEEDNASIMSIATFVSARSSSSSVQHRQEEKEDVPRYPTAPARKIAFPTLPPPPSIEPVEQRPRQQSKPVEVVKRYPPSSSRSPPSAPKPLDLPLRNFNEDHQLQVKRKPSLLQKLSLTVLKKSPKAEATGPTDYSRSPRFSSTLPGINTTVTPFPITILPSPAENEPRLTRKTSFSRTSPSPSPSPLYPTQLGNSLARVRSTSFSRAIPTTPLATPTPRYRSTSDLHSQFIRPTRSPSFSSSHPPPSASSLTHHSPIVRKSSLKRSPSRSSSTNSTPGTPQRKTNRSKIVDSATSCVSARKVTFGEVITSRISRASLDEETVEVLVDTSDDRDICGAAQLNGIRAEKMEERKEERRKEDGGKDSYTSSTLRGFGLQMPQLSMPWGRRS